MKKLITIILASVFTILASQAQTISCNASFSLQYLTPSNVQFYPVFLGDTASTLHSWSFGDGGNSNNPSPVHSYQNTGTYSVRHIVRHYFSNSTVCNDTAYMTVTIQSVCNLTPEFSFIVDTSNNRTVYFQNTSNPFNATDSVRWSFGDGTSGSGMTATHTYTQAGTYNVCIRVQQRVNGALSNCTREICHTVVVGSPCNLIANFSWMQDSSSNLVYFNNTSTPANTNDSVQWSFGDGTVGLDYNEQHTYANPGSYTVCMRIWQRISGVPNGCFRDFCRTITVSSNCNLNLSFNYSANPNAQYSYNFNNTSFGISNGDSIRWTYGDGTSGNSYNGSHTYTNPGSYNVCLRVIKRDPTGVLSNCAREYCRTLNIQSSCPLVVGFNANPTSAINTIQFTNTTTGASSSDSIYWSFGDSTNSNQINPIHTYNSPGSYYVCLRIIKRDASGNLTSCDRTWCHQVTVGNSCNLQAYFTTTVVQNATNTFFFQNNTGGLAVGDSVRWTFGDGTSSTDLSPTHTYAQSGNFNVCIRVVRATTPGTPPCVSEYCRVVNVSTPCTIQPSYTYQADSTNSFIIHFQNTTPLTTAATYVYWNFGDGSGSNQLNPVHYYHAPGQYTVCIRVQASSNCVRYYCDTITVAAGGCYVNSEFGFFRSQTNSLLYEFRPRTIDSSWTYSWNFGDSSSSTAISPAHQFAQPGTYTVCLTVSNGSNCSSTSCRTVNILPPMVCDSIRLSFVYRRDAYTPNKVYFYSVTNYPIINQNWTITNLNSTASPVTLYGFNPIYYFRDTGTYRVCLHAVMLGGCIKDTCETIHIDQVAPAPNPCYLNVFPNPASSYINLSLQLATAQTVHVYVYNSMNILVRENHYAGVAGNNTYSMFVGNLVPGTYFVRVVYGNSVCYARFMKY